VVGWRCCGQNSPATHPAVAALITEHPADMAQAMPPSPYSSIGVTAPARPRDGPQFLAALAATLGNLVMGTTIAWSSPAGPLLADPPSQDGFELNTEQNSWVGALMPVGALLGGQVGGLLMSKVGRRGGMMVGAALFAVSYLLLVVANSVILIYVGRVCTGICTGICSIICPTYVAETATAARRGFLGSCVQLMVTVGVLQVIVVGAGGSWRWISISCLVMVAVWALLLLLVPESPSHLVSTGRYTEARAALEWLRGTEVETEYQEVVRSVEEAASQQAGVLDLLKKENLAPFVISLWLMLGQQLSGMNAVMFFAVSIFEAAGTKMNSVVENIIVAVAQVVSTLAAALLMDKLGRRLLLLLSSLLMVISIGLLGLYFYIKDELQKAELAHQLGSLPVISLSVFVSAFSIGFGPIPWLMMSELFSPEVKAPASSLSTTFNWSLAFLVTKFFSNLVSGLGEAWAFWAFGLFTIITFFFCLLFVPETKGRTLDEVQQMFRSSRPYFYSVGPLSLLLGGGGAALEEDRLSIADREELGDGGTEEK